MDDTQLRAQFVLLQQGDKEALETLYRELSAPLFTIILRITQDRGLAEDVLQEVFLKLFRMPPDPSLAKPRAYLFQMAHNLALDSIKRQPQWTDLDGCAHLLQSGPEDCISRIDLEQALAALPLAEREIATLHLNGDLKFREIAAVLDLPLGTVLWKYQRALGKLRILLDGGTL